MVVGQLENECDFILIDCLGLYMCFSQVVYLFVDILIMLLNDSFVDFDLLVYIDNDGEIIMGLLVYLEMVWNVW